MDTAPQVQFLDEAVYVSHIANSLEKSMNTTILPLTMVKIVGQTEFFSFGMTTDLEKENF